jgi:O-antigen/teichoic acid export membrane protein
MPKLAVRKVIGNVIALFSGTAAAQAMTALAMFLTARRLGAAAYGQYAACFALAGLSAVIFNLGLDTWLLREGGQGRISLGRLVGSSLTLKMLAGGPWLAVIVILAPKLNPSSFVPKLVLISAAAMWLDGVFLTGLSAFKASLRNQVTSVLTTASRSGLLAATAMLIAAGHRDVTTYALARLMVMGLSAVIALVLLCGTEKLRVDPVVMKRAGRETLPYALSDALTAVYMQADVTIIATKVGEQAAGLYSPASSLVNALFLVPGAVYGVMVPVLSRLIGNNNARVQQAIRYTIIALVALGAALWIGLALLARPIIRLTLGGGFAQSGDVLEILSAILFFKSCSFAMATILVAVGWQSRRAIAQAVAAVANVVLNLLIVQRWGITGVAWVYVFTEVTLLIGYTALVAWWRRERRQMGGWTRQ